MLHVISGLRRGGAEVALLRLITSPEMQGFGHSVLALHGDRSLQPLFEEQGIETSSIGIEKAAYDPRAMLRSLSSVSELRRHDLVNGLMYHGCLYATLGSMVPGRRPLVWNIRHSLDNWKAEKPSTRQLIRWLSRLSRWADCIIYDSHRCKDQHTAFGYSAQNAIVIPNGLDTDEFRPDPASRAAWRSSLGLGPEHFLIGHVARPDPIKAHPTAFAAAEILASRHAGVHFLFVGIDETAEIVRSFRKSSRYNDRFFFLGERADVASIMPALDLLWLTSLSESHPNVILEAMASGVPCLSTEVGDVREMILDPARVVPVNDAPALAAAALGVAELPASERARLGAEARAHIVAQYGLERMASLYARTYEALCGTGPG